MSKRIDIDNKKEEIISMLQGGVPRMEICRKLDCKYDTLKTRLDKWDCAGLKNQSRKGIPRPEAIKDVHLFLLKNGPNIHSHRLKERLIKQGVKTRKCEICGTETWMDKFISLELDHINGNRFDNRLENLRILCPNCHAQQSTNSGRNIGKHKWE